MKMLDFLVFLIIRCAIIAHCSQKIKPKLPRIYTDSEVSEYLIRTVQLFNTFIRLQSALAKLMELNTHHFFTLFSSFFLDRCGN